MILPYTKLDLSKLFGNIFIFQRLTPVSQNQLGARNPRLDELVASWNWISFVYVDEMYRSVAKVHIVYLFSQLRFWYETRVNDFEFFALFMLGNQRSAVKSVQPAKELVKSNKETFHETPREHYWTKSSFCICLHTESRVPRSLLNERTLELHRFFCDFVTFYTLAQLPKYQNLYSLERSRT